MDNDNNPKAQNKGIYVTEGSEFTLHKFKIPIRSDGIDLPPIEVSLNQDLCRHWLRIAFEHTKISAAASKELLAADRDSNEKELALQLDLEFTASMQAISAIFIALEAFYSSVKDRIELPKEQIEAWKKNKTARWKQIAEVFHIAFKLRNIKNLRDTLEKIINFRDWTVHPPAEARKPVRHPDINRGVEWRFVTFRFKSIIYIVGMIISIIHQLCGKCTDDSRLGKYCNGLTPVVVSILDQWNKEFPEYAIKEEPKSK